jgi:MFS transporter, DHA3 family, macrolide efflux protein
MAGDVAKEKLFNKNFFILWHSQLLSQVGSQAFSVAMIFWIKHATGSATLMGTLLMVSMIPGAVLGPVGGVVADYYARKKIVVWCDLICGIAVLLFASLFLFIPGKTSVILAALFMVSVIVAISKAFFNPAVLAAIPDVVHPSKVPAANSITQSSTQLAMFIGLGSGGVLFRVLGAPLLFLVDGLSYLYAGLVQLFMHIPQEVPESTKSLNRRLMELKDSMVEGFVHIWAHKGMRRVFILASALNFFFAPVLVVFPFYVEDVLQESADWYGYLIAGFGAGAMMGYLAINILKVPANRKGFLVAILFVLLSVANYGMGLVHTPVLAFSIMLFCGAFTGYINVNIINQLQLNTRPAMRGRIFGNLTTLTAGIMPIALGLSGIVIDAIDKQVDLVFKGSGICMLLITLLAAFNKDIFRFFAKEPEPEKAAVPDAAVKAEIAV